MNFKKTFKVLFFLLYIILGLYIINISEEFINVPEIIYDFNPLILFISGIFLIFGGINYLRASHH